MKPSGIVRRVDELGRIVIPKEVRRVMRIKEGTPLDIFPGENGQIFLQKFSPLKQISDFATECSEAIFETIKSNVFICDKETILAYSGLGKKNYIDKLISDALYKIIESKTLCHFSKENGISFVDGEEIPARQIICPISYSGDSFGAIVVFDCESELSPSFEIDKVLLSMSTFLAKQMI